MKIILIFLVALICINLTYADEIFISAVLYDPDGSDSGYEWIELYNPNNYSVPLQNYSIDMGNGGNENDWTEKWVGNNEIEANSYFLIGEENVIPVPDNIVSLSLQNGPDAIRLKSYSEIIETLGWGDHDYLEYYMENPAEDISGKPLVRKKDVFFSLTFDNSIDFEAKSYFPHSASSNQLLVLFEIEKPRVDIEFSFPDEDLTQDGNQIYPVINDLKTFKINFSIDSNVDCDALEFLVDGIYESINKIETCNYQIVIEHGMDQSKSYDLNLSIIHGDETLNFSSLSYDLMPVTAFELDTNSIDFGKLVPGKNFTINGDLNMSTLSKPTIKNIGNVDLDLAIMGTDLSDGIFPLENLEYSLGSITGHLNESMQLIDLNLKKGLLTNLDIKLNVPREISDGLFAGNIALFAMGD